MSYQIKIAKRAGFESKQLWEMHRLRAKVFKEQMGWEVPVISGMEIDGYDAIDPHYMMISESSSGVRGCWRVLPTVGPYMLKDTFPELLYGQAAPNDPKIWELSRFAIEADGPQGFGFSRISLDALRAIFKFGIQMGIERYVTVTTASIERLVRRAGVEVKRFGPPMRIGVENAVALYIEISEETRNALFEEMLQAA